jgi:hypothetical protein
MTGIILDSNTQSYDHLILQLIFKVLNTFLGKAVVNHKSDLVSSNGSRCNNSSRLLSQLSRLLGGNLSGNFLSRVLTGTARQSLALPQQTEKAERAATWSSLTGKEALLP